METKTCKNCGKELGEGRRAHTQFCCKPCTSQWWRKENPESMPSYRMLANAKARAKKRGLPFNLDSGDILIPDTCPVLGIPLTSFKGKKGPEDGSPTLDKIVPSLGYVKGNVIVISFRANRIKTDATLGEIKAVYDFYKNLLEL